MIKPILSIFIICLCFIGEIHSQETERMEIPYYEIPAYPEDYNQHTVIARMIDGLGYRFYWATENLTEADLSFAPQGEMTKTSLETIEHVYDLSRTVRLAIYNLPISKSDDTPQTFEALRLAILNNFKTASDLLKTEDQPLEDKMIQFRRGDRSSDFPLWNLVNGHISDALYHTGQLVVFRRSSGNPIDSRVNVFMGKNRKG